MNSYEEATIEISAATYAQCADESCTASVPRKIVGMLSVERPLTAEGLIWLIASAGQMSDDPLVQAIVLYAYEHQMRLGAPSKPQNVSAGGLQAVVDGRTILLGTRPELQRAGMSLDSVATQAKLLDAVGLTVLYAAVDSVLIGGIVFGAGEHDSEQRCEKNYYANAEQALGSRSCISDQAS